MDSTTATSIISRQYVELADSARLSPTPGRNFHVVRMKSLRTIQRGDWLLVKLKDRLGLFLLEMLDNQLSLRLTSSALFGLTDRRQVTALRLSAIHLMKRCPSLAPA